MSKFILEKLLEEDIDKGGIEALTGFTFQHAAAIYLMYYFYLNDIPFNMFFETIEDLYFEVGEGENLKRYKAQVKKTKYTRNQLYKDDVISKLVSIKDIDNYSVLLKHGNFNNHPRNEDKVKLNIDKFFDLDAYIDKFESVEICLVELPLGTKAQDQKAYICGLSALYEKENAFEMKEYFNTVFFIVNTFSTQEYAKNQNSITNSTFERFENNTKAEKWLQVICKELSIKYTEIVNQAFIVEFRRLQKIKISTEEITKFMKENQIAKFDTLDEVETKLKKNEEKFIENLAFYCLLQYTEKEKNVI